MLYVPEKVEAVRIHIVLGGERERYVNALRGRRIDSSFANFRHKTKKNKNKMNKSTDFETKQAARALFTCSVYLLRYSQC